MCLLRRKQGVCRWGRTLSESLESPSFQQRVGPLSPLVETTEVSMTRWGLSWQPRNPSLWPRAKPRLLPGRQQKFCWQGYAEGWVSLWPRENLLPATMKTVETVQGQKRAFRDCLSCQLPLPCTRPSRATDRRQIIFVGLDPAVFKVRMYITHVHLERNDVTWLHLPLCFQYLLTTRQYRNGWTKSSISGRKFRGPKRNAKQEMMRKVFQESVEM